MTETEHTTTSSSNGGSDLETLTLEKVSEVSSAIDAAKSADEVVCALHSLAVRLFAVDSSLIAGEVDERYRIQIQDAGLRADSDRIRWRNVFYSGAAFPTMARILIYNVAPKWLACFPLSTKKQVYDSFFVMGPSTEIIQALVPALVQNVADKELDNSSVCGNIERLLVTCLLENEGVRHIVAEFRSPCRTYELDGEVVKPDKLKIISRVAQLLSSIPDKARLKAPSALSSHVFFRQIVIQLLVGAEEWAMELNGRINDSDTCTLDGAFLFVGETFARICRRGSADTLLAGMVPRILNHVRSSLPSNGDTSSNRFESKPEYYLWSKIMDSIQDQYALERLSEELLRHLATKNISDVEAYWTLWLLFHHNFRNQIAIRSMFVEKFLLWKVFPVCCLRWIIHFSLLECAPHAGAWKEVPKTRAFLDAVQCLVNVWSKREFIQSARMEQQAYITAAVGLCVEKMSREELETTKDILHSILQGVSCRLESPIHLVRKMASSIALVFSKVVDPKNPLYLDDDRCETVDWEFGLNSQPKKLSTSCSRSVMTHDESESSLCEINNSPDPVRRRKDAKVKTTQDHTLVGKFAVPPHEIKDQVMLGSEQSFDDEEEANDESKKSEVSDDSSLQPYDLSDDDIDLQKGFSQLADISAALRKPDDPDGVERALGIAERLVRALPDELPHISGDLVRALVHVRCSDVTVEGEEDSAEGKRQKALIALIVTSPFEALDVLTKLLYSPNVDVGQRILILDVMTEAAHELADSRIVRISNQQKDLISAIGSQPWFMPSSRGPPGAGPWKEVSETGPLLNWSNRYERELPSRPGQVKKGKSRRWHLGARKASQLESTKNRFPMYAAAFMLPAMQGFDKRRHGVDLLNRDFIVLGKLIYMLGVCMECLAMHPEASVLALPLFDMLRSREVAHHGEAYVRRSVLFAASCILIALHPSYVASTLIEGNQEVSNGLDWIRTWALRIAESDPDTECSGMAMKCLQLHAEMALQVSRSLESANNFRGKISTLPSKSNDIIIPSSNIRYQE
ncbi:telomere length regulation protein TEL2-like protein [Iris pallida]|uniref:Telomere length regulation protein TEL2-like protein n=1 Tax=Iris pallida TaxID=29817 RepID=A0AAX6HPP2_IRIPA|nr:telomere length regulation protein TEL2-like protein [Iris pallida]KAJ6842752.1 telomere length regulation protein TEL2-like protein [Iris pallida]